MFLSPRLFVMPSDFCAAFVISVQTAFCVTPATPLRAVGKSGLRCEGSAHGSFEAIVDEVMEAYPVSRRVNKPANNEPSVVEPAA